MSLPVELRQQIENEYAMLKGWAELSRVLEVCEIIFNEKPKQCLEIGVFAGRGLVPIALTLKHIGSGFIAGIDPWKNEPCMEGENEANKEWWAKVDLDEIYLELMKTIFRLGLENIALTIRARSQDSYWMFGDLEFLAVDGNHSEIASCRDVEMYLPKVKTGGLISFDDTTWPSTQKALAMVDTHCHIVKAFDNHIIFRKK